MEAIGGPNRRHTPLTGRGKEETGKGRETWEKKMT
jgi:hypothetical protein